jgi:REP element-mobilizing transposase RayT
MPRIPRRELVDGLCHVTARGNNRRRIFRTDDDFLEVLLLFDTAVERYPVVCHAFCLIPNHIHFVLEAPQPALSAAMRHVVGVFAKRFNRRYGASGHVFQGRFGSRPIASEPDFLGVVRYVLRNPVRAGLCDTPADWEWSSYHAYFDPAVCPPFLTTSAVLDAIDPRPAIARRQLAAFVAAGDSPGTVPYPNPYTPAKRSARRRTSRAAGRPTTLR